MTEPTHNTSSNARGPDVENLLRPLVTCGICMELYVNPVEFLNCLHLACGACAVEWLTSSSSCPQCRGDVHGGRDSHYASSVTEVYRAIAPNSELCQARTAEEIHQMNERYRPGQELASRDQDRTAHVRIQRSPPIELGSDSNDPYASIFNQFASEQVTVARRLTERSPPTHNVMERSIVNPEHMSQIQARCLSCSPSNSTGYVCPQRATYNPHVVPSGHTICGLCARFLPWREDLPSARCAVCTRITCRELNQPCRSSTPQQLQLFTLRDIEFPPSWNAPLDRALGENTYEQDALNTYLNAHGMRLQDVFREIVSFRGAAGLPRASWHGPGSRPHVALEDKICLYCALDLVEASLFDWWLSKRSTANLPDGRRPDCQYGITCRTARRDSAHARELNHICRPAQVDRSLNYPQHSADGRSGRRILTTSGVLEIGFPPYSPTEVTFRDKGNEPMFLCSSVHQDYRGTSTIPGRATMWGPSNTTVYFGLDGDEREQDGDVMLLLDTHDMHWVSASRGVVPAGCRPVIGGRTASTGSNQELYHCAVWWRGQRIPGYTSPQIGRAVISWDGSEWYTEDQYELLCWR